MNDLINRQDAIDEIQDEISKESHRPHQITLLHAKRRIQDLPSAQKWISCNERQPEEDGAYLVTLIYISNKGIEHRYTSIQEFKCGIWIMFGSCRIEAWTYLPEPYKEE